MSGPRVVRIPLRFANSYLLIDQKTIIVDSGDPGFSSGILKAMQENGVKKADVSMIFLTHGHIDHFGSTYELKKHLDVPVAIHTSDLLYFLNGTQAPLHPTNALAAMIKVIGKNMQVKKRYGIKAEIVFDEELKLHEYGVDALAVATPGHTLGSASVVLPDGSAVVGDLLVRRNFLFGQACIPPFLHDGQKHAESMRKLYDMGVKKFYPGHGKVLDLEELNWRLQPQHYTLQD
ncbi:MAG TPA: MBL fold metallo-hydrolase [Syntrophomonas sp.]|nr:MBL fold metallo-hydrolase [Syntrophomonas sp.]HRW12736.1 MBL fold metallo-hydrolase [Syntrophomonas sp.]